MQPQTGRENSCNGYFSSVPIRISFSFFSYSRPPTVPILVFIMYNIVICFPHLILKLK